MAASPQTENGFAMIANELLSAILHARFGLAETAVLQEVIVQMYGTAKSPFAVLNHAGIARDIEMHRQSVSRAVNRLVESNVLVRVEGGVKILKDYEAWTRDGSPRLTPAMVAKGKAKKFRGRAGERSDKKKAYVMLEAGNTIDVSTGL